MGRRNSTYNKMLAKWNNGLPMDTIFGESLHGNNVSYVYYFQRILDLAITEFEWIRLPKEIDERYLEMCLFWDGKACFFDEDVLKQKAVAQFIQTSDFDIYRNPIAWEAFSANGARWKLTKDNSVIIWNNYLKQGMSRTAMMFAKRLYELDQIVSVNAKAQKTPVLVLAGEKERLTMKNLYMQYEGNEPFIFGTDKLNRDNFTVLKTDAPFIADRIYDLKAQIWNEVLVWLGISNVNIVKRERLIKDEVQRNLGGVVASRNSRLEARSRACKQINDMFGLDIEVAFRPDIDVNMLEPDTQEDYNDMKEEDGNNE